MAEEKDPTSTIPLSQATEDPEDPIKSPPAEPNSSTRKSIDFVCEIEKEWKRTLNGKMVASVCRRIWTILVENVVLFPVAVTFFVTWWFIQFVDGFFSPLYEQLGIDIFGLGFVTSLVFVFLVGVFVSSWLGATVFWIGEWIIKRMPFVRHLYSASKQISSAVSPGKATDFSSYEENNDGMNLTFRLLRGKARSGAHQNTTAFKEVAIIRHPRVGEYAFGFITSSVTLQTDEGDEELCSVFVPTNHLYIGDVLLVNANDVIRPNMSIREGIEIIVSGGMTMPQRISHVARVARQSERIPLNRIK
ncbi:Protein LIKE COV 2 [Capsicum annuum]|nr:Protein LIKE COV 2 [Capsicum annuum]